MEIDMQSWTLPAQGNPEMGISNVTLGGTTVLVLEWGGSRGAGARARTPNTTKHESNTEHVQFRTEVRTRSETERRTQHRTRTSVFRTPNGVQSQPWK